MARHKDADWSLPDPKVENWTQASVAVLMDIRDELKALNAMLRCTETQRIPRYLRRIASNTAKPKAKK